MKVRIVIDIIGDLHGSALPLVLGGNKRVAGHDISPQILDAIRAASKGALYLETVSSATVSVDSIN